MRGDIHFYAPGLKGYKTSEYSSADARRFVSVSVTGGACALQCDHCHGRVLQGMTPLAEGRSLFAVAQEAASRGAQGLLISGGSDKRGRVPLLRHVPDMKRVRRELGLTLRVHPGLPDEETAAALGEVDLDGAMLDIIGAPETIRDVYHLEVPVSEYEAVLERLDRHRVPIVPHIVLGLHYGKMLGEWKALEMIRRHQPKLLVLVILMPLYGTSMAGVVPPPLPEIEEFFLAARKAFPDVPVALGCARPVGPQKSAIDRLAVDAGFDGIAYPAEGVVSYARDQGRIPLFHDACCGVNW